MRPLVVLLAWMAVAAYAQPPIGPPFPASLKTYLTLTDAQVSSINGLNTVYDRYAGQKQQRVGQVREYIAQKTAGDPIDTLAIGQGYAEIEAIRRDLADKLTQLLSDNGKVLTDAQRTKLKALDEAQQLLPKTSEAECQNLLEPAAQYAFVAGTGSTGSGSTSGGVVSGLAFFTLATVPVPYPCGLGVAFPADLTAYFGLTTAQLDAINRLDNDYARFVAEKQQRIAQVQAYIADLTGADVLDPGALGQAYGEIEAIQRDLRDKLTALRGNLVNVLTSPQKASLQVLAGARTQQSLISSAQCESLLATQPVVPWFNTPGFVTGAITTVPVGTPDLVGGSRYCGI